MSEQNKMLVRRVLEEVWNRGNFAVVDELIARDYVGHSSIETRGPQGYKQFFAAQRKAFPDIQ
jgi:predicted SnoaL-like aldol condensation-catalyzing enzyme